MRSTEAMNGAATRTRIAICVPVRDEFDSLPALLDAFSKQTAARDCFVVCLLFDGCLDGGQTYADARAPLLDYTLVSERIERQTVANAGRARRAAMALGTRTLAETRRGGDIELLLCTDADSVPATDWVETSIHALKHADVVAGYIERPDAPPSDMHRRVERYWERLRCLQRTVDPLGHDPAPSHPSQGGANLGFRADVYAALGGFDDVATHEDVRLVTAARAAGYRVRHDRSVRVATSSRVHGRAVDGLADTLRARQSTRAMPAVQNPDAALARYRLCAQARAAFDGLADAATARTLAERSGRSVAELRAIAGECASAESFVMQLVREPENTEELALDSAEQRLAQLETAHGCPTA
ncbi:MAG: glycosyl transferase family 2 [Salinisphaera sp.]|nr:glycosyl transferase family 2 [Salinisphaera sp.]